MANAIKQQIELMQVLFDKMYLHDEAVCGIRYHELDQISSEDYQKLKTALMNDYMPKFKQDDINKASFNQVAELQSLFKELELLDEGFNGKTFNELNGLTVNEAKKMRSMLNEYSAAPIELMIQTVKN
jgi:hypothetical protein